MSAKRPIVLAAGGTGGHLFPAQALAEELARRGHGIVLFTDERGHTFTEAFPQAEIVMTPAATFAGRNPLNYLRAGGRILRGVLAARRRLKDIRPEIVVGFGGYPALPALIGAFIVRIPVVIHEQNTVLGRVNRMVARRADGIASAFPHLANLAPTAKGKWIVTGNPVRKSVLEAVASYVAPGPGEPFKLLIFGGSQGAKVFAGMVPEALAKLPEAERRRLSVVHQARDVDRPGAERVYRSAGIPADIKPFFTDLAQRMAQAHLVIGRAGASTVTELAVIGRPAILVPLPSAMDDHQTTNAAWLADVGGAQLLPQAGLTPGTLKDAIAGWMGSPERLTVAAKAAAAQGRPDATVALADFVARVAAGKSEDAGSGTG